MSYLDPPRFSFSGTFMSNPSTINNATENYEPGVQYNNNPPGPLNPQSVWWNPTGWAFFTVPSATVTSACAELGTTITSGDPIIGAQIVSVPTGVTPGHQGRLVDLDPDQQSRSMIVGMALQITTADEDGVTIIGVVAPMTIIDIWGRVQGGSGGGINTAGCMYQSVIQNVQWNGIANTKSGVLKALYAASPDTLSIKFNVDAYNGISTAPQFTQGRFVGTIGPYLDLAAGVPEPMHVLAQRRAWNQSSLVTSNPSPLNSAPFQVKNNYLSIDLGNAIPTVPSTANPQLAGAFAELGPVSVVSIDAQGSPTVIQTLFTTAAEFTTAYTTTAGIYDVPLTTQQQTTLQSSPAGVQIGPAPSSTGGVMSPRQAVQAKAGLTVHLPPPTPAAPAATIAIAENAQGNFASLDFNALRLACGAAAWSPAALTGAEITGNAQVPLYATVFGVPTANQTLNVQTAINQYQFPTSQGNPYYISNAPANAITPAPVWVDPPPNNYTPTNIATITTDANGVGAFDVTANALTQQQIDEVQGNRRALPSQVYLYNHDWSMDTIGQPITFLVFINTPGPSSPTWSADVQPIFQQYADLYPGMKGILDLGSYAVVSGNISRFQQVMNLPMTDPGMMPVTRDLAPVQLTMINAWFANPKP